MFNIKKNFHMQQKKTKRSFLALDENVENIVIPHHVVYALKRA